MSNEERIVHNTEEDQEWADLLSPSRRKIIIGAGVTAAGLTAAAFAEAGQKAVAPANAMFKPIVPPPDIGKSPWGYETYQEPTARPLSLRPGEEHGLPKKPRPYTDSTRGTLRDESHNLRYPLLWEEHTDRAVSPRPSELCSRA